MFSIDINDFTIDLNNVFPVSGEGFIKLKSLKKIYVNRLDN